MTVSNINIAIDCWFVRQYPCSASGVWSERVLLAFGHLYLESNLTSLYRSITSWRETFHVLFPFPDALCRHLYLSMHLSVFISADP
jgi:hypothetical protein